MNETLGCYMVMNYLQSIQDRPGRSKTALSRPKGWKDKKRARKAAQNKSRAKGRAA